jgi:ribonuclease HII
MNDDPSQRAFGWLAASELVAGVDEVGRGPLAGPVVAAAVILDPENPIDGLADSKLLSAARRHQLAREIRQRARAFSLAAASSEEVDSLNVLQASLLAMTRAVMGLNLEPRYVLVDGNQVPRQCEQRYIVQAIVRGDQTVPSISAASILAKVCRDRLMRRWDRKFPGYAFASNKGYPTPAHIAGLQQLGPCSIHRMSFAPVRNLGNSQP